MRTTGLLIFTLLIGGTMAAQDAPEVDFAAGTCNCYYSSDCSTGRTCGGYGNCTASGKLDGTCSSTVVTQKNESGPAIRKEDNAVLATAIDGYFQAFLKAIKQGGGQPDKKLVAAAQKAPLSPAGRDDVEYAVWVSMDTVMGWDFMYPNKLQRATGYVGNIREVHGVQAAEGIVDAARRGLLDAVQSRDASRVAGPLQEFWARNPGFIPRHLGRCYPHGHAEVTDTRTSVACQIDTLQRLAGMLIERSASTHSRLLNNMDRLEPESRVGEEHPTAAAASNR